MRTVWNAKCGLWNAECDLFVAAAWNFSNLCTKATAERKVNRLPDIGNAPVDTHTHTWKLWTAQSSRLLTRGCS